MHCVYLSKMVPLQYILMIVLYACWIQAIDITKDVFGSYKNFLPAAFGDFNSDKLTDMFVIERAANGSHVVKVMLSDSSPPLLEASGPYCVFNNLKVISVIPSDFDGDGAMDVIVLSFSDGVYNAHILWGNLQTLECLHHVIASFKSQPLLMDYNGDMISDLFGEGTDGKRSFWIFGHTRREPTRIAMESTDHHDSSLTLSGGHAFVDVNGDFAADLWVHGKNGFEVWSGIEKFTSYEEVAYPTSKNQPPKIIGQSTFFDIDLDGDMEVLLPTCIDSYCIESVFFVYDFTNKTWHPLKVNLKDNDEITWSFPSNQNMFIYTNTITPHVGDFNLDGYSDILITLFSGSVPKVILLINSECKNDCEYPRTFLPMWNIFKDWPNSVMGTFFDFEEDGTLDVLLVNATTDGQTYYVSAYKDSVEYDAMFLKVLVLTGQCYESCPHGNIPYGTNQPGPCVSYSMLSAGGYEQTSYATQLTQSSHFALQLPFTIFGLGRNWNFVDKLKVGIPFIHDEAINISHYYDGEINLMVQKAEFTQIIPNSQLKVIPYPVYDVTRWVTQLFITPSKAMLMTAGALIATCLFVAAVIVLLHYKEKREDKKERLQQAQRFHFDAM